MPGLLRLSLALLIAGGVTFATTASAMACSCASQSEREAFGRADVVLVGVIVGRSDPGIGLPVISTGDLIAYTVRVEEALKGDPSGQLEIRSARSSASCGLEMSVGQRWRLYAYGDHELRVGACSGSQLVADAVPPSDGVPHATAGLALWMAVLVAVIRFLVRY